MTLSISPTTWACTTWAKFGLRFFGVEQRLIAIHGFSDTLFPPVPFANGTLPENDFYKPWTSDAKLIPKHGNTLMVQLVITGMKLQPCRPSFFDARDAIIQADQILTGGENKCELWRGFASRGLGPDAKVRGGTPWGGGSRSNVSPSLSRCILASTPADRRVAWSGSQCSR